MKCLKTLGLLAMAAAALMAFAGTAAATTVTAPTGTSYTGQIHATNENGHVTLAASNGIRIECWSTVQGLKIDIHGKGVTAEGKITTLIFGNEKHEATSPCTGGDILHVKAQGSLIAHWIPGTGNATLTSTGATVEITDNTGVTCGYKTENTHIGTVTEAATPTSHATLDMGPANIPRHSGSILCGSFGVWTGNYKVLTPTGLAFSE